MGQVKDNIIRTEYHFLNKYGFEYESRSGPRGESGYTRTYVHNECERLWVTVDTAFNEVLLYNELDCGGFLWDAVIKIPNKLINDEKRFINWLDEEIEHYI